MNTHTLRARITVELLNESGKTVAAKCVVLPVGAGDHHDVTANTGRAATHVVAEIGRQLNHIAEGKGLIILDIHEVQMRNAIGEYLRGLAKELEGKTLYHPEASLRAYADEVDPPLEELRAQYAALANCSLKSGFRERLRAAFAKLNTGLTQMSELHNPAQLSHCVMLDGCDDRGYDARQHCVKCQSSPRNGDIGKSGEYRINPLTGECVHAPFGRANIDGIDTNVNEWMRVVDLINEATSKE